MTIKKEIVGKDLPKHPFVGPVQDPIIFKKETSPNIY